jgi:chromosome segregation ATPase
MTEPLLNQLIEDAAGRCEEVADEAADVSAAAEALARHLGALQERVSSEASEAHRQFQELGERIEEAEAQLEEGGAAAAAALGEVAQKADEAEEQAGALRERLKAALGDLDALTARLHGVLEGRTEATGGEVQALGDQIAQAQTRVQEALGAASEAIGSLKQAVAEAQQDLDQAGQRVVEALAQIEEGARAKTAAYTDAVSSASEAMEDALVGVTNRMLQSHNQAVVALRKKFAEEAAERVESSLEPLRSALGLLAELCGGEEEALFEASQHIVDAALEAGTLMEAVGPVLAAAAALG